MQRGVAAGTAVALVAVNLIAVWYLRDRMTTLPSGADVPPRTLGPPAPDGAPFRGSVLLAATADGTVLRVANGTCAAAGDARPASSWVAPAGGAPQAVEVPELARVLAMGPRPGGWFVIGADTSCGVGAWTGTADGAEWESVEVPDDAWYLSADDPGVVVSPDEDLALPTDCTGAWLQTAGDFVYVLCEEGGAARTDRTEPAFQPYGAAEGVAGLAARADGRVATIGRTPQCDSYVKIADDQRVYYELPCFDDDVAGLGIAWAGDEIVAQFGFTLFQRDGTSWDERG